MDDMTIPVQIDGIATGDDSDIVRCVYFRVETAEGPAVWPHEMTGDADANLALLSDWAVLTGPDRSVSSGGMFDSAESIDRTIERLEKSEERFLDLAHIWIPAELFRGKQKAAEPRKGDIYRISLPLFRSCYGFVSEAVAKRDWLIECKSMAGDLSPSPAETDAFRAWRRDEIGLARKRYHDESYARFRLKKKARGKK